MTRLERLMALRMGGGTERCHTVRFQGSYSVAAHSWHVAMLMLVLWPEDFSRLVIYCLVHDIPEAWVGDIPAPTKRYSDGVKVACAQLERQIFDRLELPNDEMLAPEDRAKLRACDHLELYLWAREQVYGGNRHAACVRRQLALFFEESPLPERAQALYEEIASGSVEHATDQLNRELYANQRA